MQGSASAYAAFGYTLHLSGDIDSAIESYHQSLSRKPDDPFASEMLARAMEEAVTACPAPDADLLPNENGGDEWNGDGGYRDESFSDEQQRRRGDDDASKFTSTPPRGGMVAPAEGKPVAERRSRRRSRRERGLYDTGPDTTGGDDEMNFSAETGDNDMTMG